MPYDARKRYGLTILNYMVTSNHIHLLAVEGEEGTAIARAMQLVAGRTGQQFNQRKNRRGAYWEDRYHATAVESGEHLQGCMSSIDLNMCRAGVVGNPLEWRWCGYREVQDAPRRYRIVDREEAARLLGCGSSEELAVAQRNWLRDRVGAGNRREPEWSESLAVGGESFVQSVQERLGARARFREVVASGEQHLLREPPQAYRTHSGAKIDPPSVENTHFWDHLD